MGNSAGALKEHVATAEKTGALCFADKKLEEFPPQLQRITSNLRNLDLANNRIERLPSFLGDFKMLKSLKLSNNRLRSLPEEIGALVKLETLAISGNKIASLPASLSKLRSLTTLEAGHNEISKYPEGLNGLTKLDTVDLSSNKITTLPESMGEIRALEVNLNQNQISQLPESLARCNRLKTLRLEENCLNLEAIRPNLLGESKISVLSLAGNLFDEKKLADIEGYDKFQERFTAIRRKLD